MPEASYLAVFIVGLLGGGHCAGMCGGIVGALSTQPGGGRLPLHLVYSTGRISSYAAAGAIAGSIGGLGLLLSDVLPVQLALYVLANVMLVLLGLYLAGISAIVTRFESAGRWLWLRIQPYAGRMLPANTLPRALGVGLMWGWLPCGLVYAVLATALFAGSALQGAALMVAFGLGTLPNLLAAGLLVARLGRFLRARLVRLASGSLVLGFGVVGLAHAFELGEQIRRGVLCIG